MITRITDNHFKYENKVYYTKKETLDGYEKRKTLRNLLSRSRLLDDSEASSVKPKLATIVVMRGNGVMQTAVTEDVKALITRLTPLYKELLVVARTEKVSKVEAQKLLAEGKLTCKYVIGNFKLKYCNEDLLNVLEKEELRQSNPS